MFHYKLLRLADVMAAGRLYAIGPLNEAGHKVL